MSLHSRLFIHWWTKLCHTWMVHFIEYQKRWEQIPSRCVWSNWQWKIQVSNILTCKEKCHNFGPVRGPNPDVVYFNKGMGASHTVCWWKSSSWHFNTSFHHKQEKRRESTKKKEKYKKGVYQPLYATLKCWLTPKCRSTL